VFIKLWSAAVPQVVRGGSSSGPQVVSEEKALKKLYKTLNEYKIHPVLKLLLLVELQQKVGESVLCITSRPSIIILENTLN
jgi:hypothetical protein